MEGKRKRCCIWDLADSRVLHDPRAFQGRENVYFCQNQPCFSYIVFRLLVTAPPALSHWFQRESLSLFSWGVTGCYQIASGFLRWWCTVCMAGIAVHMCKLIKDSLGKWGTSYRDILVIFTGLHLVHGRLMRFSLLYLFVLLQRRRDSESIWEPCSAESNEPWLTFLTLHDWCSPI